MTKEEIKHLGTLARIKISEAEAEAFTGEIDDILNYVQTVQEIAATIPDADLELPELRNVWREDVATNAPGAYTETLLKAAPKREGDFLAVKKILQADE